MNRVTYPLLALFSLFIVSPASAQTIITQAKALAGGITPGDAAGYPITLSQPGAYVLGSNLTVPNGTYGLYAGADDIDLDLNGFAVSGAGTATYGFISPKGRGHVHGGAIAQFGGSGLYIRGNGWTIEDMKVAGNGDMGIDAKTSNSVVVRHSTISGNGTYGLWVGGTSIIDGNIVVGNRTNGIFVASGGRVERNEISNNLGVGIALFGGGIINDNNIKSNKYFGIDNSISDAIVSNNSLYGNYDAGGVVQINGGNKTYGNICIGKPC